MVVEEPDGSAWTEPFSDRFRTGVIGGVVVVVVVVLVFCSGGIIFQEVWREK